MLAASTNQRVDTTQPVYFELGPRADITTLRLVQRAQALAVAADYVISDSIEYDEDNFALQSQCMTVMACFGPSLQLRSLISNTAHPAPGRLGLQITSPGNYVLVARAPTTKFRLEFVLTETTDDMTFTCRGDLAARRRWCPEGTWDDYFNDPFVTAGIDGAPFDY